MEGRAAKHVHYKQHTAWNLYGKQAWYLH